MKKLVLVISAACFTLAAAAQVDTTNRQRQGTQGTQDTGMQGGQTSEQYCVKEKDGRIVMVQGQREISNDITLANGVKIKPEGPVVEKRDGTTKTLKEGECVDAQGNITKSKSDDKFKKDDDKMRKDNDNKMKRDEEKTPNRY